MTTTNDEHLRALPKVELHCHVEGAVRAATIKDLAKQNEVAFPVDDPACLYEFTSLNQFLEVLDVVCRSLRTADDFRRITYEALEDGVQAGVRYREMFFSPRFVGKLGVPIQTVWDGISAGLAEARHDLDIACRMILDLDVDTVVPGHGPLTDKAGVQTLLDYLQTLETEAKARHAAGMSREDCTRELFATLQPNWGERERVAVNVAAIYRELDGGPLMEAIEAFAAMARLL